MRYQIRNLLPKSCTSVHQFSRQRTYGLAMKKWNLKLPNFSSRLDSPLSLALGIPRWLGLAFSPFFRRNITSKGFQCQVNRKKLEKACGPEEAMESY